jgi:hypothetical protein
LADSADSVQQIKLRTALCFLAAVAAWLGFFLWMKQGRAWVGTLLWGSALGWFVGKTYAGISNLRKSRIDNS